MKNHLAIGLAGEKIARAFLVENGYTLLEKNWRFSRAEVDIIAQHGSWLIFCEVKTRSSTLFGEPEIFVTQKKKRLLLDAAINYMNKIGYCGEFRFDIIAIVYKNDNEYGIKHLSDAFFPGFEGFA
jgi:putative endonuclease